MKITMTNSIGCFDLLEKKHQKLDVKDRKILQHLMDNSRISFAEIGRKVGLAKDTVQYRFKRLVERKIIIQTYSEINFNAIGLERFHILLLTDETKKKREEEFIESLKNDPNVLRIWEFSDKWDFSVVILAKNLREFDTITKRILEPFEDLILNKDTEAVIEATEHHIFPEVKEIIEKKKNFYKMFQNNMNKSNQKVKINEIDKLILNELCKDARISTYKLAEKTKLCADAIGLRIKKLKQIGIIKKFTCVLNFSVLNYQGFVFCFSSGSISKKEELRFFEYIFQSPNVIAVKKLIGRWDLKNYVVVKNPIEYHELIKDIQLKFGKLVRNHATWVLHKEHMFNPFPKILMNDI